MFFIMVREMRGLLRPYGFRKSKDSVGGSVANASDANVSMIKFTHSICTALSGESYVRLENIKMLKIEDGLKIYVER